ncbi:MAG: SAM-dependent chlorinase/fluorinase [Candidatus Aminicenantes bacterium]|nr:MAG: SAM-dependent chlorinase/fluorinase [Candidatus Aminicenantes bacterium]
MSAKNQICGLITDFGNKDYFVGVMKGVMKRITPGIEVIDISNDIPSYGLLPASFAIDKSYRYFPASTVFLVVVDPGVGTERKILLVEYDNRYFIAPDNGVLTPILQKEQKIVGVVDNKKYFLIDGYSTFEARDKMAPAAAYLAGGIDPWEIAAPTTDFIVNPNYFPTKSANSIKAGVVYIDKFGNLMTNVTKEFLFDTLKETGLAKFRVEFNGREIDKYYDTYAYAGSESVPFMLIGSHQNLEIAMNMQSAASVLEAAVGQKLLITFY